MPQFLSLEKLFVQADCNIPPSTLFGIGVGLSALAVTTTILLRMSIGLALLNGVLVFLPLLWLYWKRAQRIAKFTETITR
jgi:tight adherence protein B